MDKRNQFRKKAVARLVAMIALVSMLAMTTYALTASVASVKDNEFQMGTVEIGLNNGKTVFDGSDLNMEPGRSIKKDFTLENLGTAEAYFRLYLENMEGTLQEELTFEIYDGDELLFAGRPETLTQENPCVGTTPLKVGETRTLTAVVKMNESAGNTHQASDFSFDITVDAVQSKNNPDKEF